VKCLVCGHDFVARAGARYCSNACRQQAYRLRLRVTDSKPQNDVQSGSGDLSSVTGDADCREWCYRASAVVTYVRGQGLRLTTTAKGD
jgi:hypothetical protein